ncbi:pseudaminic acid biosynthesis-associated methylase [Leptospira vanthielii]|uniref:Pseudaminic acid biosynthesis-associated methylase n=1 Tax=Leptospira vanthielii TaxID=293085 RepID=A0ABY2NT34_9LEPT|nr:pseudaminic acid biosynthesis-associated methylase [Leptospira vanthielii]TGM60702.1 pseudaminic acid biosynthesis-associated methylase [Leptospira vanthielii]
MTKFKTLQEEFWAGEFGKDYIERNRGEQLLASNLGFFSKILRNTASLSSCIEFGANIGMNLKALKLLQPDIQQFGIEINAVAAEKLRDLIGAENVFEGSIFDYSPKTKFDLAFIKVVLIHINPEMLPSVYQKIYDSSNRYILIAEYYNPSPVSIPYRGHEDRLFKRDFAGEMLSKFDNLELRDYGFAYIKDPLFPQDDITWFLMEKR